MWTEISNRNISYVNPIHQNTSTTYWCKAEKGIQNTRFSCTCSSNDSNLKKDEGENANDVVRIIQAKDLKP